MSYLDKVLSAIDHPKTQEIEWPDDVPKDCILRDMWKYVRYIPRSLSAEFEKVLYLPPDSKDAPSFPNTFWWVLALTISDRAGTSVFDEHWGEIYRASETSNPVVPVTVDYKIVAKWLQDQLDNPSGRSYVMPIYEQTMEFNGYFGKQNAESAKNSDKIGTSTRSGK